MISMNPAGKAAPQAFSFTIAAEPPTARFTVRIPAHSYVALSTDAVGH